MEEIIKQIEEITNNAIDGNNDILTSYGNLKVISKYLSDCISKIDEFVIKEASKYPEKTFEHQGFKFTKTDGRTLYNFKSVQKWNEINIKLKEVEELAKASANNYQKFKTQLVTDDGEVIEPAEITFSKPSLSVVLKK